jgi:hypothetical protein
MKHKSRKLYPVPSCQKPQWSPFNNVNELSHEQDITLLLSKYIHATIPKLIIS